jgi:hypothetical protein
LQSPFTVHAWQPGIGVLMHPLTPLHTSLVQALPSSQLSIVPAVQLPLWQVSLPLQALPSLHELPFATGSCWQLSSGSQVSTVHTLPSSQLGGEPVVHTPP